MYSYNLIFCNVGDVTHWLMFTKNYIRTSKGRGYASTRVVFSLVLSKVSLSNVTLSNSLPSVTLWCHSLMKQWNKMWHKLNKVSIEWLLWRGAEWESDNVAAALHTSSGTASHEELLSELLIVPLHCNLLGFNSKCSLYPNVQWAVNYKAVWFCTKVR